MEHLEEDLSAYISGELDESERRSVESHLSVCAACMTKLNQLQKLESLLSEELPPETRSDFLTRVLARFDQERKVIHFRFRRNVAILAAAAIIAFFTLILFLEKPVTLPTILVHPSKRPTAPISSQPEGTADAEMIAHLDDLENMEVIRQLDDLDQFDAAMMLSESEVTK